MIGAVARTDPRRLPALAGRRIDRRGAAPFYHQLKEILLGGIGTGWVAGDRLPSESDLCHWFGVSRTVVRQALDEMEREGLLYKVKGKGAFVTGRKLDASFAQGAAGFHESMTGRGHVVRSQVLVQEVVPASVHVASGLELGVGEPVVEVDRVRSVDGVPTQVVRAWMPHRLCPGLEDVDLRDASLYSVLGRRFGLRPHHGWRTIEAIAISAEDAGRLSVAPGSPALLVAGVTRTAADVPFEHVSAVYRGDRSRLDVQLAAPEQGPATERG